MTKYGLINRPPISNNIMGACGSTTNRPNINTTLNNPKPHVLNATLLSPVSQTIAGQNANTKPGRIFTDKPNNAADIFAPAELGDGANSEIRDGDARKPEHVGQSVDMNKSGANFEKTKFESKPLRKADDWLIEIRRIVDLEMQMEMHTRKEEVNVFV